MKNYWAQTSGMFETTEKEVLKLSRAWESNTGLFQSNLIKIQKYFGERNNMNVIDFTIRKVPEKRNNWDSAVLLVLKLSSGKFIAKRHNNSQVINLDHY